MSRPSGGGSRRVPSQERSRQLVEAVREAGRQILRDCGPEGLTTTRIAERAGVSVGSLYQYFENKEAILHAIYREELDRVVDDAPAWVEQLRRLPAEERIRIGVVYAVERHKRLLELDPEYYREHHDEFRLSGALRGSEPGGGENPPLALARELLHHTRDELRDVNLDHAAFLLSRGVPAILRAALEEQPALLSDESFLDELVVMLSLYLFPADRTGNAR